ncbi:Growth arrest specific protein 8 [Carabus blaptoides fortunei]
MPPKGKGSKSKGKSQGVVIDGVNTSEMTREQLEVFALRLKEELEREREERNFFQLERDKLRTFWAITREHLEEARAYLLNKDREIELVSEKNDEDIKNFRQKMKHLHYEHENKCRLLHAQAMMSLQQCEKENREQQFILLGDLAEYKRRLHTMQQNHTDRKKAMKMEFLEAHYNGRTQFEKSSQEMERKLDDYFYDLQEELVKVHDMEMHEFEERKNRQIANIINDHDYHMYKVQDLFDCLSMNNYLILSKLQIQTEELAYENHLLKMKMGEISSVNKTLIEPLQKCYDEQQELRKKVEIFQKEKRARQNLTNKINIIEEKHDRLKWAHIVQDLRCDRIKRERDTLQKQLFEGSLIVAQKKILKEMVCQKKVKALKEQVEIREAAIQELISRHAQPQGIVKKYESIIGKKNATIRDLEFQVVQILRAHEDYLTEYKNTLKRHNLPTNLSTFDLTKLRSPEPLKSALAIPAGPISRKDLKTKFVDEIDESVTEMLKVCGNTSVKITH